MIILLCLTGRTVHKECLSVKKTPVHCPEETDFIMAMPDMAGEL